MTSRPTPLIAFLVGMLGIATFSGMDAVMKGLVIALGIVFLSFKKDYSVDALHDVELASSDQLVNGRAADRESGRGFGDGEENWVDGAL